MFCFQWQKHAFIAIESSQEEVESFAWGKGYLEYPAQPAFTTRDNVWMECIHYPSIHATCVCCIHQLKSLTISQN